jgi:hypothetical protein
VKINKKITNISFSSGHFKYLKGPEAATTKKSKQKESKYSIIKAKKKKKTLPF